MRWLYGLVWFNSYSVFELSEWIFVEMWFRVGEVRLREMFMNIFCWDACDVRCVRLSAKDTFRDCDDFWKIQKPVSKCKNDLLKSRRIVGTVSPPCSPFLTNQNVHRSSVTLGLFYQLLRRYNFDYLKSYRKQFLASNKNRNE